MSTQPRERAIEHILFGRVVSCWGPCTHFPMVIRTPRLKPFGPTPTRAAS
jgi:hypothetical protein